MPPIKFLYPPPPGPPPLSCEIKKFKGGELTEECEVVFVAVVIQLDMQRYKIAAVEETVTAIIDHALFGTDNPESQP